jgi:hypothetical protein
LKGKVLVVATHLNRDGVNARAKVRQYYDARERRGQKEYEVARELAETAHKLFIKMVTMAKQR